MLSAKESAEALVGQRFGRLTVIAADGKYIEYPNAGRINQRYYVTVRCDCGTEYEIIANKLTSGRATQCKDCGFLAQHPEEDLRGRKYKNLTVVSLEGKWRGRYKSKFRVVCGLCGREYVVDGVNLGVINNCKCTRGKALAEGQKFMDKLRVDGTAVPYILPSRKLNKNSSTGVRGVGRYKYGYRAYITFRRKQYSLGTYVDLDDAKAARLAAEKEIYGDFLDWYSKEYPAEWAKLTNKNSPSEP